MSATTTPGWDVMDRPDSLDGKVHVIPAKDLKDHIASSGCQCTPAQDDQVPDLWIHNAYDGREFGESIEE